LNNFFNVIQREKLFSNYINALDTLIYTLNDNTNQEIILDTSTKIKKIEDNVNPQTLGELVEITDEELKKVSDNDKGIL